MTEQYLHGIEVIELDNGSRPIRTVNSGVIGVVGTAPQANNRFPLNTPVLIAGKRTEASDLGTTGTLPRAIEGIFNQTGAMVVVVRVADSDDEDDLIAHVVGGVDEATGQYTGLHALLGSSSTLGVTPTILIAPGFTEEQTVLTDFIPIAERLRAIIVADGPNTTDSAAIAARGLLGSARVFLVDPAVRVLNTASRQVEVQPASAHVAGLMAKTDAEHGFWCSPSNRELNGIIGTARPIDFTLGDVNARANLLNSHDIATIIQKDGFRLWGSRTCSSDPKWAFISVRRTADMISESLLRAHLWAVDRNITKNYLTDVAEGVNAYLRDLKSRGAILGGECWANTDLNSQAALSQGQVTFDFKFTPPYPAEHITFRASLVNDYLEELVR
jgi:hypothetical protein